MRVSSPLLTNYKGAEDHYKLAIILTENEPSSVYSLARLLHLTKRYGEAHTQYQKLIDADWVKDNKDNEVFGKTIYDGYFLALLFDARYEDILALTKKWKKSL
ncbi:MAG: hypothetical protein PHD43_21855 [Methylococcales bacterium]|nr:hypothetical protein [Methylococcales bacterium]